MSYQRVFYIRRISPFVPLIEILLTYRRLKPRAFNNAGYSAHPESMPHAELTYYE